MHHQKSQKNMEKLSVDYHVLSFVTGPFWLESCESKMLLLILVINLKDIGD